MEEKRNNKGNNESSKLEDIRKYVHKIKKEQHAKRKE